MTKHLKHLMILLLLLAIAGCNFVDANVREENFERVDAAQWPSPEPTETARPQPGIAAEQAVVAATATPSPAVTTAAPTVVVRGTFPPITPTAVTAAAAIPASFKAIGVATVAEEGAALRQRPTAQAAALETLVSGELVGIYGRDRSGAWIYGQTVSGARGWLTYGSVYALDTLDKAPVLPANPLAAAAASSQQPEAAPLATLDPAHLSPVTTAQVDVSALNMRQRPGPDYRRLDVVRQDDRLSVLAVNRDEQWALVETDDGRRGWVSTPFLQIDGSLADAPQVRTLSPANESAAAPLKPLAGAAAPATAQSEVAPASDSAAPLATQLSVTGSRGPDVPQNTLAQVATARLNQNTEVYRGPAASFGVASDLNEGQQVDIHAVNAARNWAVVRQPTSGAIGWVPVDALDIDGSLAEAAVVTTGWIESNDLPLRSGPGIAYGKTGRLAIYQLVSVLGRGDDSAWLLVETRGGAQGWLPLNFVDVTGPLADLPHLSAPPVAAGTEPTLPPLDSGPEPLAGTLTLQTQGSGGPIMLIEADGSNLRRLSHGIDPVLSPDGRQVAFTRWVGDIGQLWTINVDGTGERQILGQMRKAKGPAWSPDGSQVALNFQQGGRPTELNTCHDADIGVPRGAYAISVVRGSPKQDAKICFSLAPDPHWNLRVIDVPAGSYENYDGGVYAFRPTWDPSGSRLVSDGGLGLVATRLTPTEPTQRLTERVNDGAPVFSPDGRYLALTSGQDGGSKGFNIHRLNADGSGRVQLTETPYWVPLQPETSGRQWNNVASTWSPDGSQIAFLTDREGRWEVWFMNADGSNQRPMFSDAVNDQLALEYNFVDERILSWR